MTLNPATGYIILDKTNYRRWSRAIQRLLDARQVIHMISHSTTDMNHVNNSKAVSTLAEHCTLDVQDLCFGDLNQAHEIWSKLESEFGPTNQRLGMVASNQLSRQRWEDNNTISPENFVTNLEVLVQDVKFYGINMTDYELITKFTAMLPQNETWTSFARHVPPHKSSWEHAKETFLEWAQNAVVQTTSSGTANAVSLQQADGGGRIPFVENQELLNMLAQVADKTNCKVCLKCRRVGDHLTQHHKDSNLKFKGRKEKNRTDEPPKPEKSASNVVQASMDTIRDLLDK